MNDIIDYRYKIDENISNSKLSKLCRFYKTFYNKQNKKRTIASLQYILNVRHKKDKHKRIGQKQECIICYEVLTDTMLVTRCMHAFCDKCIVNHLTNYTDTCPMCRQFYKIDMFIVDNQLSILRLVEIFASMNQLWNIENIENTIVETANEIVLNVNEDEDQIIEYYPFLHYLQNIRAYNRLIVITFVLFIMYYNLFVLIRYFTNEI